MPQKTAAQPSAVRGAVAVEFALVLIPLLVLMMGVAEYGRALFQYNTLAKSVRDSARFLTSQNPADAAYALDEAICLTVHGNTACTGSPLAPGLSTAMVRVCNSASPASAICPAGAFSAVGTGLGSINLVQVRIVGYPFQSFLPFVPGLNSIVFNDIHTTMRQVL
ncbi:MAG: TadE-like protein [Polaromonas sp.]|nr:TadE-like protein [Polaromonas sp.]